MHGYLLNPKMTPLKISQTNYMQYTQYMQSKNSLKFTETVGIGAILEKNNLCHAKFKYILE